jgi:hypothetical protein
MRKKTVSSYVTACLRTSGWLTLDAFSQNFIHKIFTQVVCTQISHENVRVCTYIWSLNVWSSQLKNSVLNVWHKLWGWIKSFYISEISYCLWSKNLGWKIVQYGVSTFTSYPLYVNLPHYDISIMLCSKFVADVPWML